MTQQVYTPAGNAAWCDLVNPRLFQDKARWEGDKGRYSLTLQLDPDSPKTTEFRARMEAAGDDLFQEMDAQEKKKLIKANGFLPMEEEEDENGDPTGLLIVKASRNAGGITQNGPRKGKEWSRNVTLFDTEGNQKEFSDLGRGTRLIACVTPQAYRVPGSKNEVRIKLELRSAMILRPEYRNNDEGSDFKGFQVDDEEFSSNFEAAATDGDY